LLAAIENGGRQVVVDLTEATFIDSTFLGVLIEGNKRLNGCAGRISIVCVDRNLAKIFEITGLDRMFTIHTTLDEAARPEEPAAAA
jgi:anti-sigma B factor antagonist